MHRFTTWSVSPAGWRAGVWVIALAALGCQSTPTSTPPPAASASTASASTAAPTGTSSKDAAADSADPGCEIDRFQPDSGNLRAFVELARADIRLNKATIIAANLPLTDDEAAAFWPVYREYELDLAKVMDRKLVGIRKFFAAGGKLTDEEARSLAEGAIDLESERTALKRTYLKKFQEVIPATKVARFFQIDNQINMLVDLRVAAALPLIK